MKREEPPPAAAPKDTALRGLLRRRQCWCPTWRGALVFIGICTLVAWLAVTGIHPFLAVTETVPTRVLVVEGWGSDDTLQRAVKEFSGGAYDRVHVTGVPLERGEPLSEYKTWAEHGAERLRRYGLRSNVVVAVPAPSVRQDRTFASAVALRRWFETNGGAPASLNVITGGAHARRTRRLFQQAFGPAVKIGVIAAPDTAYDPARWWRSSAGVRAVVDETVAWCYARLFFAPPAE